MYKKDKVMIDLHMHSTLSDGSSTVDEILREAESKKLSLLSITDHDQIGAYDVLKNENHKGIFSGKIITGVEVTVTVDGELVEILGYGFDLDIFKQGVKKKFLTFKEYKIQEYNRILETYTAKGIKFKAGNIKFMPEYESCRKALWKEIIRYPENVEKFEYPTSVDNYTRFSRDEFYNPKSFFYVDMCDTFLGFQETIDLIHKAGGMAFLAHPFIYSENVVARLQSIVDRYNLDGIECFYYNFTDDQTQFLLDFCDKNNLYSSGGSDYHGTIRPGDEIGTGRGNLRVDPERISRWADKLPDYQKIQ